jgi:hypothetical protein
MIKIKVSKREVVGRIIILFGSVVFGLGLSNCNNKPISDEVTVLTGIDGGQANEKINDNTLSEIIELEAGEKLSFMTDGSGKAKGLLFMIDYPLSYNLAEVNRPNVVAKISSPDLKCEINLLVKKYPSIITDEQKEMALSVSTLNAVTSAMGLQMLSSEHLLIDGEKAAYTDCYIERSVGAITFRCFKRTYYTYFQNYALEVHFYIGGNEDKEVLRQRFSDYEPLFSLLIKSFTILSKGKR